MVAVGLDLARLRTDFASCEVVARVDNALAVENAEQGQPITVCRTPRAGWAQLWPSYRYLSG